MNRVRIAAVAAGLTVAMVVGVLVGGAMSTANACDSIRSFNDGVPVCITQPGGPGTPLQWEPIADEPAGAERGAGKTDVITCSITEGCDVPVAFVTDDGEVVKTLIIRLEDTKPSDESEDSE